jgi:ribosome-associated toxin RatA of RatAB toxin-antitoxin module
VASIKRSVLLPFSAEDLFGLINNVKAYPEFMDGCRAVHVLEESPTEMVATLVLEKAGLRQRFTTRNHLRRPHSIALHLQDGPFDSFEGEWSILELGDAGSKVSFDLNFELSNALFGGAAKKLFDSVASNMVNAIAARAKEVL